MSDDLTSTTTRLDPGSEWRSDGPIISATGVSKHFDGGAVKALDGIDLDVGSGEYVALTGPSGCGKSTLLHILAALDRPDAGTLHVGGQDLLRLNHPDRYRRHVVGLVFQMHNLLAHLTAIDNVCVAMLGAGMHRAEQRTRAQELLEQVHLGDRGHRRPPQLSGGERQRVALARALANRPRVLLADEPTGSLDSASVRTVLDLLEQLRTEQQVTLVVVTHDDTVAAAADRIVHLRDGRVVEVTTG